MPRVASSSSSAGMMPSSSHSSSLSNNNKSYLVNLAGGPPPESSSTATTPDMPPRQPLHSTSHRRNTSPVPFSQQFFKDSNHGSTPSATSVLVRSSSTATTNAHISKSPLPLRQTASSADFQMATPTNTNRRLLWRTADASLGMPQVSTSGRQRRPRGEPKRQPPRSTKSTPSLGRVMNLAALRSKPPEASLPLTHAPPPPATPTSTSTTTTWGILQHAKNSLRRRGGPQHMMSSSTSHLGMHYSSEDEDPVSPLSSSARQRSSYSRRGSSSSFRIARAKWRRWCYSLGGGWSSSNRFSIKQWGQWAIIFAVALLVWESHQKATFAADQLTVFKQEESMLLLHLQKIEQQSIQLHENMARLAKTQLQLSHEEQDQQQQQQQDEDGMLDTELIDQQKKQLYEMEEELNHEVSVLEQRIQQSARQHIIQEYGEGPVQVVLELDFGPHAPKAISPKKQQQKRNNVARLTILLWHDTPHAAWTWLEQMSRHVWDGASFSWSQAHVIDAVPTKPDALASKLEFLEKGSHAHESWTVGLKEGPNGKGLAMYINLQDNRPFHTHETCVGKVIDGFDTLQRLLEISRSKGDDHGNAGITIRRAMATHHAVAGSKGGGGDKSAGNEA